MRAMTRSHRGPTIQGRSRARSTAQRVSVRLIHVAGLSPFDIPDAQARRVGPRAFAHGVRQELAPLGIRVTIVEPGATTTEVAMSVQDLEARAFLAHHVSKPGSMRPEDVGGAIVSALQQPPNVNAREIWTAPTVAAN